MKLTVDRSLTRQLLKHLGGTGQSVTRLADGDVEDELLDAELPHGVLGLLRLQPWWLVIERLRWTPEYRIYHFGWLSSAILMKRLDEGDGLMLSVSYEGGSECEKRWSK